VFHHKPFCQASKGAFRPDGSATGILPMQIRGLITMKNEVDTNSGSSCLIVTPGGIYGSAVCQVSGGGANWAVPAAWTALPSSSSLDATNCREWRIVSWGLVFRTNTAATTCKGKVLISQVPNVNVSDTFVQSDLTAPEAQLHSLAPGTELTFIGKPAGPNAHLFRKFSDMTTTMNDFDWTTCKIEILGGETTASFVYGDVEVVVNLEFTPKTGHSLASFAKPSPPAKPAALNVSRQIQNTIPSVLAGGISYVENYISNQASSMLDNLVKNAPMMLMDLL
jgi:hypothetical protein